ncbi:hypothetical protein [Methanothermococcus okinawensis]|uniref:Uncharacterized protein n=1 Tax=Methanothermococcus okinawensis (strain DSM 14208 / JCM 11175 / IH1) TaxID=647113 RepID=F8AJP7_METOI|nr:hypothetical protein [Methanothermococcus okinawensis]AEH07245.1 hypothetical protein Metok_1277 [Methanothermococcus okinawensis IH1]
MLLKFYKTILKLVILLVIFGFLVKFMSNTGYDDILQNFQKNTDEDNLFNVNNYLKLTEKSLNTTENILSNDVINGNLSSVDNNSLKEIDSSINEFNSTLSTMVNLSK